MSNPQISLRSPAEEPTNQPQDSATHGVAANFCTYDVVAQEAAKIALKNATPSAIDEPMIGSVDAQTLGTSTISSDPNSIQLSDHTVTECSQSTGAETIDDVADCVATGSLHPKNNYCTQMPKLESSSADSSLSIHVSKAKESLKKNDAGSSSIGVSSRPPSKSSVVFAILFYLVTSIAMVIINKMVLNVFALPLTLLWIQLAFAAVLLKLLELTRICSPFAPLSIDILIRLAPLILINVLGLAMNTLCLQYLDASLYQVARALILPFTVILSAIILKQKSSIPVLIACAIVSGGFLIGIFIEKDVHISTLGVIFGIVSSSTSALHSIVIKKSLRIIDGAVALVYYNNLLSVILLFPLIFIETNGIIQLFTVASVSAVATPGMFLIGSVLAVRCLHQCSPLGRLRSSHKPCRVFAN